MPPAGEEMRLEYTHNRPPLLMLSDCFPDPGGGGRSARAWHLLCCAATTHQVYLFTEAGGPVNLRQWRCVAQRVRRVHIAPSNRRWFVPSTLPSELSSLLRQRRFDVLLANSPRVCLSHRTIDARLKLCDFAQDVPGPGHVPAGPVGRRWSPSWPARLRDLGRAKASQAIAWCDHALVATEAQTHLLRGHPSKAVTIPDVGAQDAWAMLFSDAAESDPAASALTALPVKPISYRQAA